MRESYTYTFPNQKIVEVVKTECKDKLFAIYNMEVLLMAAQNLDAGAFKLWCYLAMNQNGYKFALSSQDARERFGIKKSQYDTAIAKLKRQRYLVNTDEEKTEDETQWGNHWRFHDLQLDELKIGDYAPLSDNQTNAYTETEQVLYENRMTPMSEVSDNENHPCSKTDQGLFENDISGCIEIRRSSVENQTRNNIDKINSINIEYDDHTDIEDSRKLQIGNHQTIPYSKEALASAELIKEITSVPGNYYLIKESLNNNEIPDDLEEQYKSYLVDVDNGHIGNLFSI
ncbi:hypothetical protein GS424_009130 [Eggerthella guodeyinii]|uniref:Uncharacterized protein n=1 Tax=Eggerthella guodeyinii TaxID=2690837 RepID=A0A6L7ISI4_9ACTN|nr:hypothetical protein [Eggerthella guodeyinii]QOS66729.1 hypothetical protein GS424_009130 [Eggerthella guodeyinii]